MKNFIKNFNQFQRVNEHNAFQEEESFEEYVDAIADRMYENGMNGTLSSEGDVTSYGRTLSDDTAEVVVTMGDEQFKFTLTLQGDDAIEISLNGKKETITDDFDEETIGDVMSDMILN